MATETGKVVVRGGISTFSLLGVLFVFLKLTGKIAWSWWWVTSPFWIGSVVAILFVIFVLLLVFLGESLGK